MSTITVLGQPSVSTRQVPGFIRGCWNALQERRKREKVRAALYGLNGRDLKISALRMARSSTWPRTRISTREASDAARCRTSHRITLMSY